MKTIFKKPNSLTDTVFHYCPGCSHGIVHRLVCEVIDELDISGKTIAVEPVGCAVTAHNYFDFDVVQAAHGRAPAVATGIKRSLPDRVVFTYQGDGDLASIGTAETVHSAARGENITVIFINNTIYGMTGGQMAPTSLPGQVTQTSPYGRDPKIQGNPVRVCEMLATLDGPSYIARVSTDSVPHIKDAKKAIKKAFENGKAFIAFVTCGDPDLETTAAAVRAAVENGADLIELGIPFSDPSAEGPVIQGANLRALQGGVTTDAIFQFVQELRRDVTIPLVFMTYANVVFSYGTDRFMKTAKEVGMDGLILPDVPYEEKEEFDSVAKAYGLDLISLIAPTSEDRISMIAKDASGFVYCVSSLGVTGVRSSITTDIGAMVKLVKAAKDIPCAVGFGISTPEQAKKMADQSDGAIVGSAIVKLCGAYGKDCVSKVKAYVKEMKDAIR